MRTTLSGRDGNTVKFEVEVSSEELQEAFNARLRQISREVRIPGFRPGKAPAAMVRQRLGDETILADAVEESMPGWYAEAVAELDLEPVDRPEIELDGDGPALGEPLGFKASVEVMPDLVLGEYKGVEVPKASAEVEDSEVDAQMERLQNEFAELRPVSGRAVEKGDFVTADFHAVLDGEPVDRLEASDFVFELGGSRMVPGVEDQVVGMKAEEERTFPLELPESLPDDLRGKTVDFTITVKDIKEKVLPRLSDQWASEVSEFATLLELRQEIRNKLKAGKEYSIDQQFRNLAVQRVTENASIDLPETVVRAEADDMLEDFKRSLESQGTTLEAYSEAVKTPVEAMVEDIRPQAANNVKTRLVLDAIAEAEGLEASDEEVSTVVAQMAAAAKMEAGTLEGRLRKSGRLDSIREQLVRDKAVELVVKEAVAVAPAVEEPAKAAAKPKSAPAKKSAKSTGAAKKSATPTGAAKKTAKAKEKPESGAEADVDTKTQAKADEVGDGA